MVLSECLVFLRNDTVLVVQDTVVESHEDKGGKEGGKEGDKEKETVEDSVDGEVTPWFERPGHRRVVHNQSPREVRFWRGGHIDEVDGQGVRRKSVEHTIAISITVEVVVKIVDVELDGRGPPIQDV